LILEAIVARESAWLFLDRETWSIRSSSSKRRTLGKGLPAHWAPLGLAFSLRSLTHYPKESEPNRKCFYCTAFLLLFYF